MGQGAASSSRMAMRIPVCTSGCAGFGAVPGPTVETRCHSSGLLHAGGRGDSVDAHQHHDHLTDTDRIDRLRLIRSDNIGPAHVPFSPRLNWRRPHRLTLPRSGAARGAARPGRICGEPMRLAELNASRKIGVSLSRPAGRLSAAVGRWTMRLRCSACAAALTRLMRPMIAIVGSRNRVRRRAEIRGHAGARSRRRRFLSCVGAGAASIRQRIARPPGAAPVRGAGLGQRSGCYPPEHDELPGRAVEPAVRFPKCRSARAARAGFSRRNR